MLNPILCMYPCSWKHGPGSCTHMKPIGHVPLRELLESRAAAEIQQNLRFFFSLIKMDSRKYSMYRFFFSDSGRCFYSMYRFFWPIPEDAFGGRNYRFCILCMPSRLYIYMYETPIFYRCLYDRWYTVQCKIEIFHSYVNVYYTCYNH